MKNSNIKFGFGLSLVTTSILSALLVVVKEMNPMLKGWMKNLTGHHWVSHGILILVFFFVLGFILAKYKTGKSLMLNNLNMSKIIIAGSLFSAIIIAGFYILH